MNAPLALIVDGVEVTRDAWSADGNVYVGQEGLDALVDLWSDRATNARTDYYRDDLLLLLFTDGDGPAAHVVEYEDGAASGWSIGDMGWYPLEWTARELDA